MNYKLIISYALQQLLQDITYSFCVGVRIKKKHQEGTREMQGFKQSVGSPLSFLKLSSHQTILYFFAIASTNQLSVVLSDVQFQALHNFF